MMYPSIPLAQTLVRLFEIKKIKYVVICAGSRNAPLTNGFVANPYFHTYSMVDERAAAFFGLGIAQQTKSPVALLCTSGSALLNFYPAVAEAYYSDIPLIVISADRMPHRIDIGDGQTIRQTGVFEPHLEGVAELKPDVIHATKTLLQNPMQQLLNPNATSDEIQLEQDKIQRHNTEEISRVLDIVITQKGPVHFNVPLEEPLYGMTNNTIPLAYESPSLPAENTADDRLTSFKEQWTKAKKKIVIFGVLSPNTIDTELIELLCNDPSVVVLTETTSNIRHKKAVNSIDSLMAPLEISGSDFYNYLQADILLSFGGMIVSKKIKSFFRLNAPKKHWHVDLKKAYNTYYCLEQHIKTPPDNFLKALYSNPTPKISSDYNTRVLERYKSYRKEGKAYLKKIPFSDLQVFETIFKKIPKKINLQLANSSTIRYAQLFDLPEKVAVFCNRGTSGIDGSTATAVGASLMNTLPTLLITGDLSFFYDINGLWNNHIPASFRILLINNKGGGIFRILPGEKDTPKYDRYFETIHQRDARQVARSFDFRYQKVHSLWKLKTVLNSFFKPSSKPKILEIQTPRKSNDKVLLDYFKSMATNSINS
ncbi:thiamine pyrophosphate-binding protein [Flavobacteriaceae bacterium]|nr:thiamine pyrophosphate-binding protein [Flavobacteriaceae bacterium]